MNFEWDRDKAASNLRKHGISFEEAATVFMDPLALRFDDPDHSEFEERFLLIGMSVKKRVCLVVYTESDGETIWIISARKATVNERRVYEQTER